MNYLTRVLAGPDGVIVIHPAMNDRTRPAELADDAWALACLDKTIAKHPEWQGFVATDVRVEDLPPRRFRNAWRADGRGAPSIDMPAARAIRIAEIRAERDQRLAASDGEMLREQETGGAKLAALRAYRQALRDVPTVTAPTIEAVGDPDGLAALEPDWPIRP